MRRRSSAPRGSSSLLRLDAPTPTESGVYPIGVFSDAELAMSLDEAEETLASFTAIGARLRRGSASGTG